MSINSNNLLKTIKQTQEDEKETRMAKVTRISDTNVYITFYGEEDECVKPYKRISSYTPTVNDIVVLQKVGNSYVITGKVV